MGQKIWNSLANLAPSFSTHFRLATSLTPIGCLIICLAGCVDESVFSQVPATPATQNTTTTAAAQNPTSKPTPAPSATPTPAATSSPLVAPPTPAASPTSAPTPTPTPTPTLTPSPSTCSQVTGQVVNATNKAPLSNVQVQLTSSGGIVLATTTTDLYGNYSFNLSNSGTFQLSYSVTGYSNYTQSLTGPSCGQSIVANVAALSPANISSHQMRIVLTWTSFTSSGAVRDMDSYLLYQDPNGYYPYRPIYFGNKNSSPIGANLDVDSRNWGGPETITITSPLYGTYYYYIANYNNNCDLSALGNSNVQVNVYSGSTLVKNYKVAGGSGNVYLVFKIAYSPILFAGIQDAGQYIQPTSTFKAGLELSDCTSKYSFSPYGAYTCQNEAYYQSIMLRWLDLNWLQQAYYSNWNSLPLSWIDDYNSYLNKCVAN